MLTTGPCGPARAPTTIESIERTPPACVSVCVRACVLEFARTNESKAIVEGADLWQVELASSDVWHQVRAPGVAHEELLIAVHRVAHRYGRIGASNDVHVQRVVLGRERVLIAQSTIDRHLSGVVRVLHPTEEAAKLAARLEAALLVEDNVLVGARHDGRAVEVQIGTDERRRKEAASRKTRYTSEQ